jgi:pimeloyl-ACP methyl ester carboxylesterase
MQGPLVLIPGLACTELLFEPLVHALEGRIDIHVADVRGPNTMEGLVEKVLSEAPPYFTLAGLSMGGYIALEIALRAPDVVSKLALLDAKIRPDTEAEKDARRALIERARNGDMDDVVEMLIPRLLHPDHVDDAEIGRVIRIMAEETGAETFIAQEEALLGRRDISGMVDRIAVPTLILVGDADVITPPDAAEEMHEAISQSQLVTIEHAGHLTTLEQPEAVAEVLAEFLQLPLT